MSTERHDLLASLLPIAKALRRIEDAAAARFDITMWQYAILSIATAVPGMSQSEAADMMGYSRNRIIADLDELEKRELLVRVAGADRRVNTLRATESGMATMREIRAEIHRQEDALLSGLSPTARRDFHQIARRLGEQLRRG
jgi:DNA-binding MarR family transcriptional regulator